MMRNIFVQCFEIGKTKVIEDENIAGAGSGEDEDGKKKNEKQEEHLTFGAAVEEHLERLKKKAFRII